MKGLIIIGYQGIGKSSCAGPANKCIDLESGNFFIGGRDEDEFTDVPEVMRCLAMREEDPE